jgi:hypothetical protein
MHHGRFDEDFGLGRPLVRAGSFLFTHQSVQAAAGFAGFFDPESMTTG